MHVAAKVHMILRMFVVLTWMHDNRESMYHYGITHNQHCNNDNDDNVMRVSMWFEFFGGLF